MNAKSLSPLWLTFCSALAFFAGAQAQPAWAQAPANTEVQASDLVSSAGSKSVPSSAKVTVTNEMMSSAATNPRDWVLHGKDYNNQRYSPLSQINDSNINSLTPAAIIQTGMTASFETTPLVLDGVMYATTPVVDNKMKVMAFNAATGARIWETAYNVSSQKLCCGPVNRGVAAGYGNLYVATTDADLVALNAKDGSKVWETNLADPQGGYSETMTPQIYDGMVIVGSSGGEWPLRGFVAAYDAKTGKQIWKWDSTDPNTFEGQSWKTGGGMVWTTPAVDPKRGLVIFAVGNPNPDLNGESRKGDNLYTDSLVALNAKTGKLAWYYQEVKHDVWDYDAVSNVVLFDAKDDNGNIVPAAGEAGKVGWFFIVNRDNGKLIRKSEPFVKMNENMFKAPTKEGINILPGANGGAEWSPPAYSPRTHDVYVPAMDQLMKFTSAGNPETLPGTMRLGSTFVNVKDNGLQDGTFSAINVDTGNIDWQYKAPQPLIGGALATGGNLVFTGEGNGWFDAFNAKTGEKVWRYNLGAGVNAPPISYEVDGRQYVAVAAGGNFQLDYPRGDAIAIFALPENATPKHASAWDSWRDFFGLNRIEKTSKQASR
jgi:alcohol dehydrogenase (cytochrome c)